MRPLFAYSWTFPAYSVVFLLTVVCGIFCFQFEFVYLQLEVFYLQLKFFSACSGKVRLINALADCKQRNSSVSEKLKL